MLTMPRIVFAAIILISGSAALAQEVSTAQWKTFTNAKDGYSFRYPEDTVTGALPPGVKASFSKGKTCINGDCSEAGGIKWYDTSGNGKITILEFTIQRNLNPSGLPLDKLYTSMTGKPLQPDEQLLTIGGKPALQAASGSYFIELNKTDILSLPCHNAAASGNALALNQTCKAIALSLTFP